MNPYLRIRENLKEQLIWHYQMCLFMCLSKTKLFINFIYQYVIDVTPGLKIRVSVVRLTRHIPVARPSGALRAS